MKICSLFICILVFEINVFAFEFKVPESTRIDGILFDYSKTIDKKMGSSDNKKYFEYHNIYNSNFAIFVDHNYDALFFENKEICKFVLRRKKVTSAKIYECKSTDGKNEFYYDRRDSFRHGFKPRLEGILEVADVIGTTKSKDSYMIVDFDGKQFKIPEVPFKEYGIGMVVFEKRAKRLIENNPDLLPYLKGLKNCFEIFDKNHECSKKYFYNNTIRPPKPIVNIRGGERNRIIPYETINEFKDHIKGGNLENVELEKNDFYKGIKVILDKLLKNPEKYIQYRFDGDIVIADNPGGIGISLEKKNKKWNVRYYNEILYYPGDAAMDVFLRLHPETKKYFKGQVLSD